MTTPVLDYNSKIALLATGDEINTGDILNTNGQAIAKTLHDQGFHIGMHITTSDDEAEITKAIKFLLQDHQAVLTTGGLGPTSDDRTRFALAAATDSQLDYDEASWQRIVERLNRYRITIHESNKQQCYFPIGAEIFPNENGTASGCMLPHKDKLLFMLPGPPAECLPMFQNFVLPELQQRHKVENIKHFKWRLFGVSEGETASQLDQLVAPFHATTGYRWDYPYLEFKINTSSNENIEEMLQLVEEKLKPHIICTAEKTASELLHEYIMHQSKIIVINDKATGGLLQLKLQTPDTRAKLKFKPHRPTNQYTDFIYFEVKGLHELWQGNSAEGKTKLTITCDKQGKQQQTEIEIPFRNRRITQYAAEYACYQILQFLQEL